MKTIQNFTIKIGIIGMMMAATFIACKKEADTLDTPAEKQVFAETTTISDVEAEEVFDDVLDNVMGAEGVGIPGVGIFMGDKHPSALGDEVISAIAGTDSSRCFKVTRVLKDSTKPFPVTITLDFGTGCTDPRGRTRKGKIITEYTGNLLIPGSATITRFENYYLDSFKVEGTHKIVNVGTLEKRAMRIIVNGAKLSKANGDYTQWNSEKTIEQVEGLISLINPLDDIFKITGAGNGAVKKGEKFYQWSKVITEPLVKRFSCRWFSKGIVKMKHNDADVAELNFGDGNCDNIATLTINGVSKEITLR